MIRNPKIHIKFSTDDPCYTNNTKFDFVLAPPRIWTAIKILVAPTLWVGESFTAGEWYLCKGDLSDFLETVLKNAPHTFRRYYEFTAALRGLRHYVGQYLLNRYYTRKVKRHYEVDSKIYEMILDQDMVYTCGFREVTK